MTTSTAQDSAAADADFERLYQQAYYRHSGFGPDADDAAPRRSFLPRRPDLTDIGFAALALVFFVVPAVAAAAIMA
jgi:hypothetical protein